MLHDKKYKTTNQPISYFKLRLREDSNYYMLDYYVGKNDSIVSEWKRISEFKEELFILEKYVEIDLFPWELDLEALYWSDLKQKCKEITEKNKEWK